jgi:hypothetical protein
MVGMFFYQKAVYGIVTMVTIPYTAYAVNPLPAGSHQNDQASTKSLDVSMHLMHRSNRTLQKIS